MTSPTARSRQRTVTSQVGDEDDAAPTTSGLAVAHEPAIVAPEPAAVALAAGSRRMMTSSS